MTKVSLYQQAANKTLPAHQYMDEDTLTWIKSVKDTWGNLEFDVQSGSELNSLIKYVSEVYIDLVEIPEFNENIFSRGEQASRSIHGYLHAYRTSFLSALLARINGWVDVSPFLYSGLFHDIARSNDQADHGHGKKSAERLLEFKSSFPNIKEIDLLDALYAIEHHESVAGEYKVLTDTLKYLKAADALDRFRLPKLKWWPNKAIMEYLPPEYVFTIAYRLVVYSEQYLLIDGLSPRQSFNRAIDKILGELYELN